MDTRRSGEQLADDAQKLQERCESRRRNEGRQGPERQRHLQPVHVHHRIPERYVRLD